MKKISLCICFYNAEEFIERAINSFVNYLTDEIEVVLVDDGSNDKSIELARIFALKYNQIIIVQHEYNKGLSIARKTAVEHSTSKYVMFLDADDEFISDPFSYFLNRNDLNEVDIFEYGAITDFEEVYLNNFYDYEQIIDGRTYLDDYFRFKNKYVMLCLRLFRRDMFFPKSFSETFRLHEDNMSLPLILSRSNKVVILDNIILKINSNPNSLTRMNFSEDSKTNLRKKLHLKSQFYYELILHLDNNLEIHSKNLSYNRFIIQMALYHSFYSATESMTHMLLRQKRLGNNSLKRSFLKFDLVNRIKSPINVVLIIFGFRLTSVLLFYISKLNILTNQRIRKLL